MLFTARATPSAFHFLALALVWYGMVEVCEGAPVAVVAVTRRWRRRKGPYYKNNVKKKNTGAFEFDTVTESLGGTPGAARGPRVRPQGAAHSGFVIVLY